MSFRTRNEEKSYKIYKANILGCIRFFAIAKEIVSHYRSK